jgi:hypothetical protein
MRRATYAACASKVAAMYMSLGILKYLTVGTKIANGADNGGGSRHMLLALGPAPIQMTLGFPSTQGACFAGTRVLPLLVQKYKS